MIKQTITYTDYDGISHTDDFYFHLSKPELVEMKIVHGEGYEEYLKRIIQDVDGAAIMSAFREIIGRSIGIRQGSQFIRDDDFTNEFMNSAAYEELFMNLVTNTELGLEFAKGVMPADMAEKAIASRNEPREYSHDELLKMSDAEFHRVAGHDNKAMSREHLLVAYERKNRLEPA